MMTEENLSFTNFFRIIFKRLWIVVLFTLVAGLSSAYVSYYVLDPIYEAKVNLLVSFQEDEDKDNPTLSSQIDESLKLVVTYQDIILSPLILKDAQQELNNKGYNIRIDEKDVSVGYKEKSQVLELLVEDPSTTTASLIANEIAASVAENAQEIMGNDSSSIKVLNSAAVSSDPVSPQPLLIIGITLFMAFVVSIWLTLLIGNMAKNRKRS